MTTPREKYERRRQTLNEYIEAGKIDTKTGDAIKQLADAYDDHNVMVSTPPGESTREPGTLLSWVYRLMMFAAERDLTDTSIEDLKSDIQRMHDGTHSRVKDGGIKKSTLRSYQAALRRFYGYHDFGIDPDEIPLFDQDDSHVNPADMLTKEDIQEAREATGNPRDRALFDLLLYTGLRREALRTLRLKDVDVQNGTYRLNPDVDGLKGAQKRNGNRPLLGAKGALQNWLEYHPDTSDPENYLITARPSYSAVDPSSPISGETVRATMQRLKDRTTIDKPMNPHAMRHNFVTIAKRNYDMPNDTIKYLIGHDDKSRVMETTYSHLSGDDHVQRAEEAWGIRQPENDSPLTPDVCNVCGNPLEPDAKACSRCGAVFTPDAQETKDQIEETLWEGKGESEAGSPESEGIDAIRQVLEENPEAVMRILEGND